MGLRKLIRPTLIISSLFMPVGSVVAAGAGGEAADFAAETGRAMAAMDAEMMARPSGDVDQDFVAMMVPHHEAAIDMAMAELRYGHSEQLKRIAQEIIVDQQQEIAAMRLALGQQLPPSVPAPTQADRPMPDNAGMSVKQEH